MSVGICSLIFFGGLSVGLNLGRIIWGGKR